MLGPQVRAAIRHGLAHLNLWGRDTEGHRWALLVWEDYASRGLTRPVMILCSGWLPSADVQPVDGVGYGSVWQARLGPNPADLADTVHQQRPALRSAEPIPAPRPVRRHAVDVNEPTAAPGSLATNRPAHRIGGADRRVSWVRQPGRRVDAP